MAKKTIQVNDREVSLSNTDKVFFPEIGYTKCDMINYYQKIADIMLPHMRNRPISMQRFPDGIDKFGFYEKAIPAHFPEWIKTVSVDLKEEEEKQNQVMVNDTATLVYLANQACIIPHIWLSKKEKLDFPDKLIFDLDPPSADDFDAVRNAALTIRDYFEERELHPFVMTTGSKGLHLVISLDQTTNFDETRAFAYNLAEKLTEAKPEMFTTEVRKNKRGHKIFLDYLRNAYGQTSVPPYAIRALTQAPVATPLEWNELHDTDLSAQTYTVKNIFRRLGQKEDPWKNFCDHSISVRQMKKNI